MNSILNLKEQFAQPGKVEWIGLRPKKRSALTSVTEAELTTDTGLVGDHYSGRSGKRHLTLIQAEHLQAIAAMLGKDSVAPETIRRNVVVSGINLLALRGQQFTIGECELEATGLCHPCSRMEANLGTGGYNAMRGHGGITARVLKGGSIRVGDSVGFKATTNNG